MEEQQPKEPKPSSIARILGQVSRGFRRRSPLKVPPRNVATRRNSTQTTKENTASPLRKTLNRLSLSKKSKINKEVVEEPSSPNTSEEPVWSNPRALSENDLRHVTIRRGTDIQTTPLAGATQFMSEANLSAIPCSTPISSESRVPSYIKISCALNGYRSPASLVENTPLRPPGKGLVERRLAQLCGTSSNSSYTKSSEASPMGATCSSPSVKNLIGQFDRWKLCMDVQDTDVKENIKPATITTQPDDSNVKEYAKKSTYISPNVQQTNYCVDDNVCDIAEPSARSGSEFGETLATTRSLLEDRCTLALHDLDTVPTMPEQAADSIRLAVGKAKLLLKKKLAKFEELLNSNLNPKLSDKVATTEDLEGYWALVEMELIDVNNCFSEVEKWRLLKYSADDLVPEQTIESNKSEKNNNSWRKSRPVSKPTTGTVPLTEKQKALAEQRKKSIAEARAKAKLNQETSTTSSNFMIL